MPLAADLAALAWTSYEVYRSSPVAAVRALALARKLWQLAWTGRAAFAFGLIRVTQPRPLANVPHFRRLARRPAARIRETSSARVSET